MDREAIRQSAMNMLNTSRRMFKAAGIADDVACQQIHALAVKELKEARASYPLESSTAVRLYLRYSAKCALTTLRLLEDRPAR